MRAQIPKSARWHENNKWHGKGSRTNLVLDERSGELHRAHTRVPPSETAARATRQASPMASPARAGRQSLYDGIHALGQGLHSAFGQVPFGRPGTVGSYAASDARPGVYSSLAHAPLLSGNGGGGLLVGPPHLEPAKGVAVVRHVRASIAGLFSSDASSV